MDPSRKQRRCRTPWRNYDSRFSSDIMMPNSRAVSSLATCGCGGNGVGAAEGRVRSRRCKGENKAHGPAHGRCRGAWILRFLSSSRARHWRVASGDLRERPGCWIIMLTSLRHRTEADVGLLHEAPVKDRDGIANRADQSSPLLSRAPGTVSTSVTRPIWNICSIALGFDTCWNTCNPPFINITSITVTKRLVSMPP